MEGEKNPKVYVEQTEEEAISRLVLIWLDSCPEIPAGIGKIGFESLNTDEKSFTLSVVQGAYVTKRYILGGHQAEYQCKLIYRIKPGNSMDARLRADEALNRIGVWCSRNKPDLGALRALSVEATTQAELYAMYESGWEDHQIFLKLIYEVI